MAEQPERRLHALVIPALLEQFAGYATRLLAVFGSVEVRQHLSQTKSGGESRLFAEECCERRLVSLGITRQEQSANLCIDVYAVHAAAHERIEEPKGAVGS